jgi:hypothetical protein
MRCLESFVRERGVEYDIRRPFLDQPGADVCRGHGDQLVFKVGKCPAPGTLAVEGRDPRVVFIGAAVIAVQREIQAHILALGVEADVVAVVAVPPVHPMR